MYKDMPQFAEKQQRKNILENIKPMKLEQGIES